MSLFETNYLIYPETIKMTMKPGYESDWSKKEQSDRVVWEGNEAISWNSDVYDGGQFETINADANMFSGLQENDIIKIYFVPQLEDPQYYIQYKHGDDWDWTNLDGIVVENNTMSYTVLSDTVTEIADRGLIITGQGYNITKITIIPHQAVIQD